MSEQPQPKEFALPGAYLSGVLYVQCFRCAQQGRQNVIEVQLRNETPLNQDEVDDILASCTPCSAELGAPAAVPITILAGEQVDLAFAGEDEADAEAVVDNPADFNGDPP